MRILEVYIFNWTREADPGANSHTLNILTHLTSTSVAKFFGGKMNFVAFARVLYK